MAKGVSIKFKSYSETIPALLNVIRLGGELKKYDKIIIKPFLSANTEKNTSVDFVEQVLKYCLDNKNPVTEVFIAEGSDGANTLELFDSQGYKKLAETYSIGLVDLNETDTQEIEDGEFLKFDKITYPKILLNSFIISLPKLSEDPEYEIIGSLSNMLGAFPASKYQGFFSSNKSKIRKWPVRYSIHDILKVKMPDFAIIDASAQGAIIAGKPLDADKQALKILGKDVKSVSHIRLIEDSFKEKENKEKKDEINKTE